jgi:FkbM family methyltransferase
LISQILGRSNQVIQTYRKDRISHVDMEQDLRLLIPGERPLLLDVGANKGQTIAMFKRVLGRPKIHAFEPNQSLVRTVLTPAHGQNADVVLNAGALGAAEGSLTFHQCENDELSSFLPLQDDQQNPFKDRAVTADVTVPVWTLDQYVEKHQLPPIDLLKIDTQGYDLQVLHGARAQLTAGRIGLVMLEINFVPMYAGQPTFGEVDDFLRGHGYALVDMYEKIYQNNRLAWCTGLYQKC